LLQVFPSNYYALFTDEVMLLIVDTRTVKIQMHSFETKISIKSKIFRIKRKKEKLFFAEHHVV
jgi:hypothetical protein